MHPDRVGAPGGTDAAATTLEAPVFIGGAGRSGTTLLRVMLDAHPSLAGGPEFKTTTDLARLYATMRKDEGILGAYRLGDGALERVFRQFLSGLFAPFLAAHGARRLVEKTPHNILYLPELASICPDARFLHVVRDGRDVASSLVTMDWRGSDGRKVSYVTDIDHAFRYWTAVVAKGITDAQSPALRERVWTVRYEDLVREPESTLRAVLSFLGEPWSDSVLRYREIDRSNEPLEDSSKQVREPLSTASIGRWRQTASAADRALFARVGGELLRALGYETDEDA